MFGSEKWGPLPSRAERRQAARQDREAEKKAATSVFAWGERLDEQQAEEIRRAGKGRKR